MNSVFSAFARFGRPMAFEVRVGDQSVTLYGKELVIRKRLAGMAILVIKARHWQSTYGSHSASISRSGFGRPVSLPNLPPHAYSILGSSGFGGLLHVSKLGRMWLSRSGMQLHRKLNGGFTHAQAEAKHKTRCGSH
jgi:hypothetical protein